MSTSKKFPLLTVIVPVKVIPPWEKFSNGWVYRKSWNCNRFRRCRRARSLCGSKRFQHPSLWCAVAVDSSFEWHHRQLGHLLHDVAIPYVRPRSGTARRKSPSCYSKHLCRTTNPLALTKKLITRSWRHWADEKILLICWSTHQFRSIIVLLQSSHGRWSSARHLRISK